MSDVETMNVTSRGLELSHDLRPLRIRPFPVVPAVECLRRSRYSGAECWCRFIAAEEELVVAL